MKKMINIKLSLLAIAAFGLLNPMNAQDEFTYSKEIEVSKPAEVNKTVSNLTLSLINETKAKVCAQCTDKNVVIIEGRMPLTLSDNPSDLAYTFNGYIDYKLQVDYNEGVRLTFTELKHKSKNSINGFDLNYGQLLSNGSTSKNAVFRNYDFLLEDYRKITPFQTDKKMEQLIQQKTIDKIDELIAVK